MKANICIIIQVGKMKNKKIFTTYIDPETDIEYSVTGDLYRGRIGTRNGFDRFAEPDEPDEIDNISIYFNGKKIEVSDELFDQIEQYLYENGEVDDEFDF